MSDKTYIVNDRDDKNYWKGKIITARPYVPASGPDPLLNRSKFVPRVKKVERVTEVEEIRGPRSAQVPVLDIPEQNVKMSYEDFLSAALPKLNKKQKRETEPQTPTKKRTQVPVYSPSWNMATPDSVKKEYMEKSRLEQEAISPTNLFPEDEDSPEEFTELFEITEEKGGRRRVTKLQKTNKTKKSRKSKKTGKGKKSGKTRKTRKTKTRK